jgi:hypothetical protein
MAGEGCAVEVMASVIIPETRLSASLVSRVKNLTIKFPYISMYAFLFFGHKDYMLRFFVFSSFLLFARWPPMLFLVRKIKYISRSRLFLLQSLSWKKYWKPSFADGG